MLYLPHSLPSVRHMRLLFAAEEVGRVVKPPWNATPEGLRFSQLRAHLDRFIEGSLISMAQNPFTKPRTCYMARIDPSTDEVWDIRSIDPRPAIRVLGCFADTDLFIALVWENRKNLGGPHSKEWRDFRERGKAMWRNLFPAYQPLRAASINEYVSEKVHVV
ncbi:MAG: hypothetical protein ACRD2G_18045 [Terriglobia bacterium]